MSSLCEQLFDATWDDLDLQHLRAFCVDAGEEGLTWEVKGGELSKHNVRKAACAFCRFAARHVARTARNDAVSAKSGANGGGRVRTCVG